MVVDRIVDTFGLMRTTMTKTQTLIQVWASWRHSDLDNLFKESSRLCGHVDHLIIYLRIDCILYKHASQHCLSCQENCSKVERLSSKLMANSKFGFFLMQQFFVWATEKESHTGTWLYDSHTLSHPGASPSNTVKHYDMMTIWLLEHLKDFIQNFSICCHSLIIQNRQHTSSTSLLAVKAELKGFELDKTRQMKPTGRWANCLSSKHKRCQNRFLEQKNVKISRHPSSTIPAASSMFDSHTNFQLLILFPSTF